MRTLLILFTLLIASHFAFAQVPLIKVKGKVISSDGTGISNYVMVVNLKSGHGQISGSDGSFEIKASKGDTIAFASMGYVSYKISFRDSAIKNEYNIVVKLNKTSHQLQPVVVTHEKSLDEIRTGINKLGEKTSRIKEDKKPVYSPVEFLYEEFSKKERSKRRVAELQDEDQRRAVLKDFIRICMKSKIINLKEDRIDKFVSYLNIPDEFLRTSTDYEILVAIKEKYREYMKPRTNPNMPPRQR